MAYFASRNFRNDDPRDGSWPWTQLQKEWAEQPRYFWVDRSRPQPRFMPLAGPAGPLAALGGRHG